MRSVYESIALDLAKRIVEGELAEGEKISGRTVIAGKYGVSAETVRKAIALLRDANIVAVSQGKEVLILSSAQAAQFIAHQASMHSAYSLRQELELLLAKKKEINKQFEEVAFQIAQYTDRLRNLQPYNPIEVKVENESPSIGKSVADLGLWQRTGATLVAIRRGVELMISPGPKAVLEAGDRLVVVGKGDVLNTVNKFIN